MTGTKTLQVYYLHAFEIGSDLRAGLAKWIAHYNRQRPHTAGWTLPDEVYHTAPTPSEWRHDINRV